MKTITKIQNLILIALIATITFSCEKERVKEETTYTSLDEFYETNKPEEQLFIIDSTNNGPVVGKDGTTIWNIPATKFMYVSNHKDVFYPYVLKLVEAYSIKNMILSKLPTVAQGKLLKSGGEIKITAFKDNQEMMLKENESVSTSSPNANPDNMMDIFYGFTKGSSTDWNNNITQTDFIFNSDSAISSISTNSAGYLTDIAKLGWFNIDRFYNYTNKIALSFTAEGVNTELIDIYIVFKNINSFIQVSATATTDIPLNESIIIVAIGKNNKGEMLYFKQGLTTAANISIELKMDVASESDIINMLGNL